MKKNISINIQGLIFYIEEDCYEPLRAYLGEIHRYFAKYEDSREIIEDIEGRIAEIFCEKLSKQKQVITQADVEDLIAQMGSIDDFQNAEEVPAFQSTFEKGKDLELPTEQDFEGGTTTSLPLKTQTLRVGPSEAYEEVMAPAAVEPFSPVPGFSREETYEKVKRLYRDTQRKVVGGVAAGMAHFIGIDPIWIRILLILLVSGWFFLPAAPATVILCYLILWAVVPGSDQLEENLRVKKLYRDPERGVLGGVAAGLAAYLGVSELSIRVVFFLLGPTYGTGVLIYIILWIIVPMAKTLIDRMQMQGELINLQNIRQMLRENLAERVPEMGAFHKVLVFPFQLMALFLQKMATLLRPFVGFAAEFIRIVGGFTLILSGLALVVAEVFVLLVLLGVNFGTHITVFNAQIPPALIPYTLDASALMVVNFFITLFPPTFFLALFGVMMLMRRILWQPRFGWSLVGLWLLSTLVSGVLAGLYAQRFQANGKTQIIQTYALPKGVLTLDVQDSRKMRPFVMPQLQIQGYEGKELKLMIDSYASGESEMQARANAQTLEYRIRQQKASLIFEEQAYYTEGAKFRAQSLHLTLYVPDGQVFTMQPSLVAILRNTLHPYGYKARDLQKGNQWRFEEGELVCLNCPNARRQSQRPLTEAGGQWLDVGDFDEIEASGPVSVVIKRGTESRIKIIGDPSSLSIENNGETLEVRPRVSSSTDFATLEISLPYLKSLSLSGAIEVFVEDLRQDKLKLDMSGASQLVLSGQIKRLMGDLSGASVLEAFQLETDEAALSLSGASEAKIKVNLALEADLSGASELRYQGQPSQVDAETSGESTVRRE